MSGVRISGRREKAKILIRVQTVQSFACLLHKIYRRVVCVHRESVMHLFVRRTRGGIGLLHSRRLATSLPRAQVGWLPVPGRQFLEVQGKDRLKFLQGIVTNDTSKLEKAGDCLACVFLTAKGRVLADAMLYNRETGVVVEVHETLHATLLQHLKTHKLRSAVTFKPLALRCFLQPLGPVSYNRAAEAGPGGIILATHDPRGVDCGTRILMQSDAPVPADVAVASTQEYDRFRLLRGLPEPPELSQRVPFECNLDLLNYISFSKGCYIGQELMARTKFRGTVRKRMQPYLTQQAPFSPSSSSSSSSSSPPLSTATAAASPAPAPAATVQLASEADGIPESLYESHGVGLALFAQDGGKEGGLTEATVHTPHGLQLVTTYRPALFNAI